MIVDKAQMEIELIEPLISLLKDTTYYVAYIDHLEEIIYLSSIDAYSSFCNSAYLPFSVKGYDIKLEEQ